MLNEKEPLIQIQQSYIASGLLNGCGVMIIEKLKIIDTIEEITYSEKKRAIHEKTGCIYLL